MSPHLELNEKKIAELLQFANDVINIFRLIELQKRLFEENCQKSSVSC